MGKKQSNADKSNKSFFGRHKIISFFLIIIVLCVLANACSGGDTGDKEGYDYNAIDITSMQTKDVMNGTKTEKIGEYVDVNCDNTKLTDEELIQFYKEYIQGKDYNWVSIQFGDGTGLHFAGCDFLFTYSTIDEEDGVTNDKGTGYIITDEGEDKERVEYDGEDYTK